MKRLVTRSVVDPRAIPARSSWLASSVISLLFCICLTKPAVPSPVTHPCRMTLPENFWSEADEQLLLKLCRDNPHLNVLKLLPIFNRSASKQREMRGLGSKLNRLNGESVRWHRAGWDSDR